MADTATLAQTPKPKLVSSLANAKRTIQRLKGVADDRFGTVMNMLETNGSAFGFGYARGKLGDRFEIFNVPMELVAGITLHALAMFDVLSDHADDARNIGNGALAAYLAAEGFKLGQRSNAPKQAAAPAALPQGAASGAMPNYQPSPLYQQPINDYDLAAQMRANAP